MAFREVQGCSLKWNHTCEGPKCFMCVLVVGRQAEKWGVRWRIRNWTEFRDCLKLGRADAGLEMATCLFSWIWMGLWSSSVHQELIPCPRRIKPVCSPSIGTGNHVEDEGGKIAKTSPELVVLDLRQPLSWPLHLLWPEGQESPGSCFWKEFSLL